MSVVFNLKGKASFSLQQQHLALPGGEGAGCSHWGKLPVWTSEANKQLGRKIKDLEGI